MKRDKQEGPRYRGPSCLRPCCTFTPASRCKISPALTSGGFSFVISYESRSGPGFHGHTGFVASWRPIHQNTGAIKIGGSPFKTLAEAEEACKAMLGHLTR